MNQYDVSVVMVIFIIRKRNFSDPYDYDCDAYEAAYDSAAAITIFNSHWVVTLLAIAIAITNQAFNSDRILQCVLHRAKMSKKEPTNECTMCQFK